MSEDHAFMYVVLGLLVLAFAVLFYVFYAGFVGWLCGVAGDSLTAC